MGGERATVDHEFQQRRRSPAQARSCAILGGVSLGDNVVPRLEGIFGPAVTRHESRSGKFNNPIFDVAFIVLYVDMNEAVRIAPVETRYGSMQSDHLLHVVARGAMVCGGGG